MTDTGPRFRLVSWMAGNPVAANLLMFALVLGGVLGFMDIRQEITPDFTLETIRVSVAYPGASPEEVEEGIVLAIEKELTGMNGIRTLRASAPGGLGRSQCRAHRRRRPGRGAAEHAQRGVAHHLVSGRRRAAAGRAARSTAST